MKIFVTVGTHEQPFDRLLKWVDKLKEIDLKIGNIVVQSGYCRYFIEGAFQKNFFDYQEMIKFVHDSDIIITHGGPASFLMAVQMGKVPIVVPRIKSLCEHVNDHQLHFCGQLSKRGFPIIVVQSFDELVMAVKEAGRNDGIKNRLIIHSKEFCLQFENIVYDLMK